MPDIPKIEIRNKEGFFGATIKNTDGSPVQVVVQDAKPVQEIRNKEGLCGTEQNADGSPVKVIKFLP